MISVAKRVAVPSWTSVVSEYYTIGWVVKEHPNGDWLMRPWCEKRDEPGEVLSFRDANEQVYHLTSAKNELIDIWQDEPTRA